LGHDEAAWRLASRNAGLWHGAEVADLDPSLVAAAPLFFKARRDSLVGDWTAVLKAENGFDANGENYSETLTRAEEGAEDHDAALARSFARAIPLKSDGKAPNPQFDEGRMLIAMMLEDWNTAVLAGRHAESHFLADPKGMGSLRLVLWRQLAYALARTGQSAEADSMIAKTPLDCDPCVRARGSIAAAERNWISAGHDFSIVASRSPDIPFADAAWGEMLLRKGEYDAAIAKFRESNLKGPHFADPLEMWGEALMQENRSDLALAKFEEANNYAPNWGRLHLEWGKALFYVGRKHDAGRQFRTAAGLDLSTADRAALARVSAIK
jgi:tetratricopeptide (TPR) repeat protein